RIAAAAAHTAADEARCVALARYLAELHRRRLDARDVYRRAARDLVGSGEGIFGMLDAYGSDTPAAPPARLEAIERRADAWRWRLRGHEARLSRIHGDFHPFNVVFAEGEEFTLLDASRGCAGDPADDVTAMAVNYVFFAVDHPEAWARGLGPLWRAVFRPYIQARR